MARRWVRPGSLRPWWRRFKANGYRLDRCDHCGHRFRWSRDARFGNGNRDGKHFHGPCLAYLTWQRRAEDRLRVLGVAVDLTGITSSDVREAMSLRASNGTTASGSSERNIGWRVFYDLEKSTKATPVPAESAAGDEGATS